MPKLLKLALIILFNLYLGNLNNSFAQNYTVGGRSAGIGNASVTLNDFWSVQNNQAGMAFYENIAMGFAYENRFITKELGLKTGALIVPTNLGSLGLTYQQFGYSAFNRSKLGLAFARSFGNHFSVGLQLDYLHTKIGEDYGTAQAVTFEIGFLAKLSDNLKIGAHVFNPINSKLSSEYEEKIPAIYKLGIAYLIAEKLMVAVETEKNMDYKPLLRGGIEYWMTKSASVRLGLSSVPSKTGAESFSISSEINFGFGLDLQSFILDFAASMHQTLGWSPQVSLIYKINKIEN